MALRAGTPGLLPQAVYKTFVDVVHVEKTEGARLFSVAGPAPGEDSPGAASPGVDVSQPDAAPLNTTDSSREQREAQEARLQARTVSSSRIHISFKLGPLASCSTRPSAPVSLLVSGSSSFAERWCGRP